MLILMFAACSVFQPLDGTWLFQFERDSSLSGDCAGDDSGGAETTYEGTNDMWVDAYTITGNQIVIVLGVPLVGTLTGANVEASHETGYESGGVDESESTVLEASLAGGTMEGTVTTEEKWSAGSDSYRCTRVQKFTASRATSSPDSYAGN